MRVHAHGNLTVELIRQQRFGDAGPPLCHADRYDCAPAPRRCRALATPTPHTDALCQRIDRVELSRQALGSDPWAIALGRASRIHSHDHAKADSLIAPRLELPPRTITPVIGSPSLAGLGVSLIVPGTLLDVVA